MNEYLTKKSNLDHKKLIWGVKKQKIIIIGSVFYASIKNILSRQKIFYASNQEKNCLYKHILQAMNENS